MWVDGGHLLNGMVAKQSHYVASDWLLQNAKLTTEIGCYAQTTKQNGSIKIKWVATVSFHLMKVHVDCLSIAMMLSTSTIAVGVEDCIVVRLECFILKYQFGVSAVGKCRKARSELRLWRPFLIIMTYC